MAKLPALGAITVLSIAVFMPLGTTAFAQQTETMGNSNGMKQSGMAKHQGKGAGMKAGMGQGSMMKMQGMGNMDMMQRMMKMRKKMMGKMFMVRKKAYSNADIKRMVDGRLAKHGFSKLIAGDVADGADGKPGTAIVSVVSPKGEMLFKVEVNRKNGMAAIIE